MPATLTSNRSPSEVGDTGAYNRLEMQRATQSRGDPSPPVEEADAPRHETLRVLIVDNCRDAADTLSWLIAAWGHDVRRAYDGSSALALAAEYQPDVLLLDILMPNMSGLELARQVHQQARGNDCVMIAVTGCTDNAQRQQCEEAGIDLFLIKPVEPVALQTLLMFESAHVFRSRQDTATHDLRTAALQSAGPSALRPTQQPCRTLQGMSVG